MEQEPKNSLLNPSVWRHLVTEKVWKNTYEEMFVGSGTQIYVNNRQVFDVVEASADPYIGTYVKLANGTTIPGEISLVVNGIKEHHCILLEIPVPEFKIMLMTTTKDLLRQVLLRRPSESGGHYEDVFWIDNRWARLGTKVKDEDGVVWQIAELYNVREFIDMEKQRAAWKRFSEVLEK